MRFHVVGVGGGTGALLSYHIKRASRLLVASSSNNDNNAKNQNEHNDRGRRIRNLEDESLGNLPNPSVLRHLPNPIESETGVTLRMRKFNFVRKATYHQEDRIIIEKDGIAKTENDFNMQWTHSFGTIGRKPSPYFSPNGSDPSLAGTSICESIGYPKGTIDTLLIATKPQHTVSNLEPLVDSLSPASTLILVQNGQGILDEIIQKYFPNPNSRPNIILASSTHKVWTKSRLHAVHFNSGRIDLAVIPNTNTGTNYERIWKPTNFLGDDELRRPIGIGSGGGRNHIQLNHNIEDQQTELESLPSGGYGGKGGFGWFMKRNNQYQTSSSLDRSYATAAPSQLLSMYANPPLSPLGPSLDMDAIPQNDHTKTLRETLAILQSLPLDVRWQPIRRYQLRSMQMLVANACIEPITALIHCRNGHLFGNKFAEESMRDVCNEASLVLRKMAERTRMDAETQWNQNGMSSDWLSQGGRKENYLFASEGDEDDHISSSSLIGNFSMPDHPSLDPSLLPGALLQNVRNTIKNSATEYSRMSSDLNTNRNRNSSEIAYINGYIGRMGRSLGIPTPVNNMLVSMVRLKQSRRTDSPLYFSEERSRNKGREESEEDGEEND